MNSRERVYAMIRGEGVDRLPFMPITMMFAADVAGIPYRAYASDHRQLVEAQIRTAEAFAFDYVSVISDPAREAADFGAAVEWFEDQPPAIDESNAVLSDRAALARLRPIVPEDGARMRDRVQGVALLKEQAAGQLLVEGWVEGPCAESADLRGINHYMMDLYEEPAFAEDLAELVLEQGLLFARAQIAAGADIIGVGDAAASLIGPDLYEAHVWPYEKRLVDGIHAAGGMVRLHVCGNTTPLLEAFGRLGCEIVDLDFPARVAQARAAMGPDQVLLGNIDPVRTLKEGTPESVWAAVEQCHREAGARFIVGAGCEVPRGTPVENLRAMQRYAAEHAGDDASVA